MYIMQAESIFFGKLCITVYKKNIQGNKNNIHLKLWSVKYVNALGIIQLCILFFLHK